MATTYTIDDFRERTVNNVDLPEEVDLDIEQTVFDDALQSAADWHSNFRPLLRVHTITGDGSSRYDLPSQWEEGFSNIQHIEYPVDYDDPSVLDKDEYRVWLSPEPMLLFRNLNLDGSDTARMVYTARHRITADEVTIPDHHFEALCHLATFHACKQIAGILIKNRSTDGGTEGVFDFRSTSDMYRRFADEMFDMYCKRIGIPNKMPFVEPHFRIFNLPDEPEYGGDWTTHGGYHTSDL